MAMFSKVCTSPDGQVLRTASTIAVVGLSAPVNDVEVEVAVRVGSSGVFGVFFVDEQVSGGFGDEREDRLRVKRDRDQEE